MINNSNSNISKRGSNKSFGIVFFIFFLILIFFFFRKKLLIIMGNVTANKRSDLLVDPSNNIWFWPQVQHNSETWHDLSQLRGLGCGF